LRALRNLTDEAVAPPMCCFNKAWRLWIIAQRFAYLTDGDFEDGVTDEGVRPDRVEQLFFGDELTRTLYDIVQDCEGFRSELDYL
jgi:hypothetical protein